MTDDHGASASPLDTVAPDSPRPTESTVRIGLVLPDVMGTYGDDGNALVLRQRLRWRGHDAEIVRITLDDAVPDSCDVYTVGGGEDSAQKLASRHLSSSPGLQRAVARGVPVLAICAGMQVFGEWFAVSDGSRAPGLGLLDVTTTPQATRAIGELVVAPSLAGLTQPLTGFENHMGATVLGPDAAPLGRQGVHAPALEQDPAGGDGVEPGDHPQDRGLARARGAEHGQRRAGLDREVDPADDAVSAVAAGDADESELAAGSPSRTHRATTSSSGARVAAGVGIPGRPPTPQPNERPSTAAGITATATSIAAYGAACE